MENRPLGLTVPRGLGWWRGEPGGADWLDRLPALAAECADEWSLELGAPFEPGHISLVVPARLPEGEEVVLKLNFPEPESEHEADALAHWNGDGAVRLLARDDERRALLLERCRPGSQLWTLPEEEANEVAADVLLRLWQRPAPEGPFRRLEDEARRWAAELPRRWEAGGRPFERALLDESVAFLEAAAGEPQRPLAVLHQDLHGGNILRASGEDWLAIDPKPLVGERAFDTASLLRDRRKELARDPDSSGRVRRRLDLLSERLGLERERLRGWGIAHALAWGWEGGRFLAEHATAARVIASVG